MDKVTTRDPDTLSNSLKALPDQGKKLDSGKLKWRLFPLDALREIGKVLTWGAYERPLPDGTKGYGENNWEHVQDARKRYYDALQRHVTDWYDGTRPVDEESGYHSLAHAGCCLLFLLALDIRKSFK